MNRDIEMLALVVDDALDGIDISQKYPAFYRRLLVDSDLRAAFTDAVALLNPEHPAVQEPLPYPPVQEIPFLDPESSTPPRVEKLKDGWRIFCERSREQLASAFGILPPAESSLAWRGAPQAPLDPDSIEAIPLLRERVWLGDQQVEALLEAVMNQEGEPHLYPTLVVAGVSGDQELMAFVNWGNYADKVKVSAEAPARFAPVPLATVFDGEILTALELTLTLKE